MARVVSGTCDGGAYAPRSGRLRNDGYSGVRLRGRFRGRQLSLFVLTRVILHEKAGPSEPALSCVAEWSRAQPAEQSPVVHANAAWGSKTTVAVMPATSAKPTAK